MNFLTFKRNTSHSKTDAGFTLLISIVVTSMLLLVSFVVSNLALKQLVLSYSGQESEHAFYNADSGIECALYWDVNGDAFGAGGGPIVCNGQTIGEGENVPTVPPQEVVFGGGTTDTIWVADSLPSGAEQYNEEDGWNWLSLDGKYGHQSPLASGSHQHYFINASPTFAIDADDNLIAYVYLDPDDPPTQVLMQWKVGTSWEHRAYWGANDLCSIWSLCSGDYEAYHYVGVLPPTGGWRRLSVPASEVGLDGTSINGIAFTLYGGKATWDDVGKSSASGVGGPSIFSVEYDHGCAIVNVTKNGGVTTIESRGYNTCDTSAGRRFERAIRITY